METYFAIRRVRTSFVRTNMYFGLALSAANGNLFCHPYGAV